MPATSLRIPPAVPHRRYPSLSDDGQPYFPRLWRKGRTLEEFAIARAPVENERPVFLSVRAITLLAIVAIIAALVAVA